MKIRAKQAIALSGRAYLKPGETDDFDDDLANALIERGQAEAVTEKKAPAPAVEPPAAAETETEKKPKSKKDKDE